ncbi:hypothetical protein [Brucella sp. NBRC 12952]
MKVEAVKIDPYGSDSDGFSAISVLEKKAMTVKDSGFIDKQSKSD